MPVPSSPKHTTSIKLDIRTKQALQSLAKQEDRSVHYLLVCAVEDFVKRKQEENEYQEYIKNRVMCAYNEMKENGSQGVTSSEAKKIVMERVKEKLENNN